jgi:hypothetical protein
VIVLIRLGKVLVVFALVATISAHWALLQTVAWTSMLASNLQSSSLPKAVAMTFDGQHPCPICKAIDAGKKSEQKNQVSFEKQKLEFPPVAGSLVLVAPSPLEHSPRPDFPAKSIFFKPLTPPPRALFV